MRALDLAATAVLFSVTLLFVSAHPCRTMRRSRAAGILASAATAFLLGFGLVIRASGQRIAAFLRARLSRKAPRLANGIADRLLELQIGFSTLRSASQFAGAFAYSMLIWFGIALSYLFTAHSLPAVPPTRRVRSAVDSAAHGDQHGRHRCCSCRSWAG